MNTNCVQEVEMENPEFLKVLDELKNQLSWYDEICHEVSSKVNSIKQMDAEKCNDEIDLKSSPDIIGQLWDCVNRLKKYNVNLDQSRRHLNRYIG